MVNPVREIFGGFGVLLRGFAILLRKPRLFLLGMLPAVITSVLFVTALVVLVLNVVDLVAWATPFADDWDTVWQGLLRGAVSVGLLAGTLLLMVVAFTTVTLALGSPVYDKVGELVEAELGSVPQEPDESILASVTRSARQSIGIIAVSLLVTVAVFVIGFVPFAGQVAGPVLAALFGGWVLAIELMGGAFERRGLPNMRDRRRYMRTRRLRVLGFAVPTYFLLAIPLVAIAVFPAAAAGGTILARELAPASEPPAPEGAPGDG